MNRPLISPAPLHLAGISASKCVSRCVSVSAGRELISKPNRHALAVFVMFAIRRRSRRRGSCRPRCVSSECGADGWGRLEVVSRNR